MPFDPARHYLWKANWRDDDIIGEGCHYKKWDHFYRFLTVKNCKYPGEGFVTQNFSDPDCGTGWLPQYRGRGSSPVGRDPQWCARPSRFGYTPGPRGPACSSQAR